MICLLLLLLALPIVNVSVDALHQGRKALLQWAARKLGREGAPTNDEEFDDRAFNTGAIESV